MLELRHNNMNSDPSVKPLVTLLIPAFNEAAVLPTTIPQIDAALVALRGSYDFEAVVVDDGSSDETATVAADLAARHHWIRLIRHPGNRGLSEALRTGFANSRGQYVVVLDADMSYGAEHIGALLEAIVKFSAQIVVASPYMEGGKITNIPRSRYLLSRMANRFLSYVSNSSLSTLTSMVRAYDGPFIRAMVLRGARMALMPEVIYKAMILRAKVVEIPAHLDWSLLVGPNVRRRSSMRILPQIFSTLMSGFAFRPFMFFILPGLFLGAFAAWVDFWIVAHFVEAYRQLPPSATDVVTTAVAQAYAHYPYTFIVGLLTTMLSVQLLALGILALQAKRYFEEIFSLGIHLNRRIIELDERE